MRHISIDICEVSTPTYFISESPGFITCPDICEVWACIAVLLQNIRAQSGVLTEARLLQSYGADITELHFLQFQTKQHKSFLTAQLSIFNIQRTQTPTCHLHPPQITLASMRHDVLMV
jgi:hypothetical protein